MADDSLLSKFKKASDAAGTADHNSSDSAVQKLFASLRKAFLDVSEAHDAKGGLVVSKLESVSAIGTLLSSHLGFQLPSLNVFVQGAGPVAIDLRRKLLNVDKCHLLPVRPQAPPQLPAP